MIRMWLEMEARLEEGVQVPSGDVGELQDHDHPLETTDHVLVLRDPAS